MVDRRKFLKTSIAAAVAASVPGQLWIREAFGTPLAAGLSDPALQPKFANPVPNALDPGFIFDTADGAIRIGVGEALQNTGLMNSGSPVPTKVWGYGQLTGNPRNPRVPGLGFTWPGRTIVTQSGVPLEVKWENRLIDNAGNPLPLPVTSLGRSVVDTSLHWAYSLHGYTQYSLENDGFPIVPHVHGGHTDFQFDGNPEFFFSPEYAIRGPQWVEKGYMYDNSQPAGTVWYHDHALGITRLNVYAGMAGFYIIRDDFDTGLPDNPAGLPAFPYEAALAIQDKMFHTDGSLFYPAYPGDPFYADFIDGEGAILPPDIFPGGGPTGLAEFFGDHMVVNGVIWPKMDVEPRNYRLRLLNGCDSRFLVVRFRAVDPGATVLPDVTDSPPIPFKVIGSDQGLASSAVETNTLVIETGSRYDVLFDFGALNGKRIIMENIGGDTPFGFDFGDDLPAEDLFPDRQTDRIMAFDVILPMSNVPDATPDTAALAAYAAVRSANYSGYQFGPVARTRKVALFEGTDEFGRLQPLLGTAEPATDYLGNPVNWPATPDYANAGLVGQMDGAIAWHSPTTENPNLGDTEEWEVFNVTGDSHPVHLHLVHFDVLGRKMIKWDSNAVDGFIPAGVTPAGDGTYLVEQPVVQHNGTLGSGFRVMNATYGDAVDAGAEYVDDNSPKDMVTARPGEVTKIRATFDKPGRYVWHCHILSHEDHEMMRVMHVGPGA
jgi:FtsP/CotA-like multicopper oxidase with cupredoxin domain